MNTHRLTFMISLVSLCVVVVIFSNWAQILVWIDKHESLAAWIQGIGSIAAIAIAIVLWRRDIMHEQREKKLHAGILAFRLAPALIDIEEAIRTAFKSLDHIEKTINTVKPENTILAARLTLMFPPLPDASIYNDFTTLEPNLARLLAHLFYTTSRHDRQLEKMLEIATHAPQVLSGLVKKERDSIARIKSDLDAAMSLFAKEFSTHLPPAEG